MTINVEEVVIILKLDRSWASGLGSGVAFFFRATI
jgi:hypothetical protein